MEINSSSEEMIRIGEDIKLNFERSVEFNSKRPMRQDCTIFCCGDEYEEAYSPNHVLIGPLIYADRERCQNMITIEMQKRIYLASFLHRAETKAKLDDFLILIRSSVDRLRTCYEQTFYRYWDIPSNFRQDECCHYSVDFQLFLVDAGFIIELFLRAFNKKWREKDDFIIDDPVMVQNIRRDLFLVQNQLPFFILKDIYQLAFAGNPDFPSFLHLACHFFSPYYNQNTISPSHCHDEYRAKLESAKHFTDLIRTIQLQYFFHKEYCSEEKSLRSELPQIKWIKTKVTYFLDLISSSLLPISSKKTEDSLEAGQVQGEYLYSAVLLREAGVKFKVSTNGCILDIEFNQSNGELKITPLLLDKFTETYYRNLMAWEQRYYRNETHICDYIFIMEYLIKSAEDVDLLVRKRILINQFGSHTAVVTLFNKLIKDTTPAEKNHYSDIFGKLNAYSAVRHHNWIAILRLQYFSTLWKGVATIAAVILLVLTLIQTICAFISL